MKLGLEPGGLALRDVGRIAALAEAAGFSFWAPESYVRSAVVPIAQAALATTTCTLGTAIAYGVGRSPLVLAAEARDLDELSGGRFVLGLGNGTRRMISDWHGADPQAPAKRVEELVPLLRRLWRLHEEPVHHDGRFYRVHLAPPGELQPPLREHIPVYVAAVQPRMARAAAAVADGLLGHPLFNARYIDDVIRPVVDKPIAALVTTVIRDDVEEARRVAATQLAHYACTRSYAGLLDASGFATEGANIRAAFARRDLAAMAAAVSDAMIDAMAITAPSQVERYRGVLDEVILFTPTLADAEALCAARTSAPA